MPQAAQSEQSRTRRATLALTALGVVYGDIATSPIYSLRECFNGKDALPATPNDVRGVLSLIFWALALVVSFKYLVVVLRADNEGEGGILALLALLDPFGRRGPAAGRTLVVLGLFGAALLYGDGMITPAISVLSSVEGLEVATPAVGPYVVPITVAILSGLFLMQRHGTGRVGSVFGPFMVLWLLAIAGLGVAGIVREPAVLLSVSPHYAVKLFVAHPELAFAVLGAVFLTVTGGEALYADLGHFGRSPIRTAWFILVLPALLLNYFGQGALLLVDSSAKGQPFYHLAPGWALYPLIALATGATIIASQAVISGAFSLTSQAVQLGYFPRMQIVHTSSAERGQIYVPVMNGFLWVATIALVVGFGSSSNLAGAYGVAIATTMVITTVLIFVLSHRVWGWKLVSAGGLAALFLVPDLAFFGANILKIPDGGWVPILVALGVLALMLTWQRGRQLVFARVRQNMPPFDRFLERLDDESPHRIPGTAVFMTGRSDGTPPALVQHVRYNGVLHEQVVLLTVDVADVPHVPPDERLQIDRFDHGFVRIIARYGFRETPDVPRTLKDASTEDWLTIDLAETTYYMGTVAILPTDDGHMAAWRKRLFAFMARNAERATAYYKIPRGRVFEVGGQIEI